MSYRKNTGNRLRDQKAKKRITKIINTDGLTPKEQNEMAETLDRIVPVNPPGQGEESLSMSTDQPLDVGGAAGAGMAAVGSSQVATGPSRQGQDPKTKYTTISKGPDPSPRPKCPSIGGNRARGSSIAGKGAPSSRGQVAGPLNTPKRTMEQLVAGIMAASGPPETLSPPCRTQPKNNHSTMNHRFIVANDLDKSGAVPMSKLDGKKKERALHLLEAEEAQDEAAERQIKVNKQRSKEAYDKKQQERRAAKHAEKQQRSGLLIEAAQTQIQSVETTQQAGSVAMNTMIDKPTLTDTIQSPDSSTNQADIAKMDLNNPAGSSSSPVVPAQPNNISHATEITRGVGDQIGSGLSQTTTITSAAIVDSQMTTISTEQAAIISSPSSGNCTDASSPSLTNGLKVNDAKSDGAYDNNIANIEGWQTNSSEPQTATDVFYPPATVRLQTDSPVRPNADLMGNMPDESRARDVGHSQEATEISNKLHTEKANVSAFRPQDPKTVCSPVPLSEVRVRPAFNWWDDVEMAEPLDSNCSNAIVAEASELNGVELAYACFDEDVEMEIGDVLYPSAAAWIEDGLATPAISDAMEVDEAGDGDGVANWSFMSQPANDAWSPGKPQWSAPMGHGHDVGQPTPLRTHQLEPIPVVPVLGQAMASATPKTVIMESACVANRDLDLLTKLRDAVVASRAIKGKSTTPSKDTPVTLLPVPQTVEKSPASSRDPPGIPPPVRTHMLPVEMRKPLKNNLFPPRGCTIYPIRHGGRYSKKSEDNAAAYIRSSSNEIILGKPKKEHWSGRFILPGMIRHCRILDDGRSQFLMQCAGEVNQKTEDKLTADGWNRLSGSPKETAPTSRANLECVSSQDAFLVEDEKASGLTVINLGRIGEVQAEKAMSPKKTRKCKKVNGEQPAEHEQEHEHDEHTDLVENFENHQHEETKKPAQTYVPSTESMWISVGMFAVAAMIDFLPWKSLW